MLLRQYQPPLVVERDGFATTTETLALAEAASGCESTPSTSHTFTLAPAPDQGAIDTEEEGDADAEEDGEES